MMPINEAAEVLKKLLACRTELYCRTYCSECPNDETHIRKISAIETAIAYLEKGIETLKERTVRTMTIEEAVKLLHYGTDFEIKGAYSGKVYHSTRRNKRENLEKYFDKEVTDEPFYAKLTVDKDLEYCRPIIGIWMCDYNLCRKGRRDGENR